VIAVFIVHLELSNVHPFKQVVAVATKSYNKLLIGLHNLRFFEKIQKMKKKSPDREKWRSNEKDYSQYSCNSNFIPFNSSGHLRGIPVVKHARAADSSL